MGPYYEREGAVNMGVACHIYSASEDGPRGWGGKSPEFISSEANGIWCCKYHADLIDKASGSDYPASVLFAWKALAEARALKQMNDRPSPLGWVESIEFTKFGISKKRPKILLSRCTILVARNGGGKTVLMEAAASISQAKYAERFCGTTIKAEGKSRARASFSAKVVYSTVDSLSKEAIIEIIDDRLTRRDGSVISLLPPGDLEVVYCSRPYLARDDDKDDLDLMVDILNMDKGAVFALAEVGAGSVIPGRLKFKQATGYDEESEESYPICKKNGEPHMQLLFREGGSSEYVPFWSLSGSERNRLVLDLLIAKSREVSKQRLTLLLIDDLTSNFDSDNFASLLKALANEDFQVVLTLPPSREKDVLQSDSVAKTLQKLDHLEPWRLATIADEFSF
ncbi:hypothetical protein ACQUJZ_16585 [Ralstonia pseudosolanacearum]|uniref:hypothetical protein n=1 Tax=Ralstonia pseudosolanacearum TaxID=1310165 RepID=UPI0018D443E2|nr:hypothetical protein [Ralstonia pseudosolanacearum]UQY82394.1 hypothetical protein JNO62_16445 [Ralstonia pseudosolanacearum]